ncbi:hypothetical protein A7X67_02215 [Clostridium sp. W14A]|jgi:Na+-driven multidrug efflux pump|nr:hypothetical protein A7X67_02215 [Clostridium sp. W14A]
MFASILFFTYGFQAMAIVYLPCIKYSRAGFLFSISRQGTIYIPALWLLQQILEKNGIYYAPAAVDAITTLSVILFLCATKEQRKSLPKN